MSGHYEPPPGTLLGIFYPRDFVVAMVADAGDAERVAAALREADFTDVGVWSGDDVLRNHQQFLERRGLGQRLGSSLASEEKDVMTTYLDSAGRGEHLIQIHLDREGDTERVAAILADHGAHAIHRYGRFTITRL